MKTKLAIVPVARAEEVLKAALVRMPEPISWDDEAAAKPVAEDAADGVKRATAH